MLDFRVATFLTVCETMNYTRAAEALHITQPAVSQHIHYLENYYDTKLFLSSGKKLELTATGKLLYQSLSAISHDTDILKLQFSQLERRQSTLRLGSTLTIGEFVLKMPLVHYIKNHPEINLSYQIADTHILVEELKKGEIDLALIEGYYQKQDFNSLLYRKEKFYPVCSTNYRLTPNTTLKDNKTVEQLSMKAQTSGQILDNRSSDTQTSDNLYMDSLSLDNLLNETLLVREKGSGTRNVLEHYLEEYHLSVSDFKKVIEINNLNVIRSAAKEGCGITFLFESVIREDLDAGTIRQLNIKGFPISHDFTFLWQKNSIHGEWYKKLCHEFC